MNTNKAKYRIYLRQRTIAEKLQTTCILTRASFGWRYYPAPRDIHRIGAIVDDIAKAMNC